MKNRRGDIPIMILVLGVVAICGLAILSFIVNENLLKGDFKDSLGLEVFELFHSDLEKDAFARKVGAPENLDMKNYEGGSIEIKSYAPIK